MIVVAESVETCLLGRQHSQDTGSMDPDWEELSSQSESIFEGGKVLRTRKIPRDVVVSYVL